VSAVPAARIRTSSDAPLRADPLAKWPMATSAFLSGEGACLASLPIDHSVKAIRYTPDHEEYESLPAWTQKTLQEHAKDEREHAYSLEDFAAAKTHDTLWNAAQTQLVREGKICACRGGKRSWNGLLHRRRLALMTHLNNKYALDGGIRIRTAEFSGCWDVMTGRGDQNGLFWARFAT
jgi:hypothetical protein